MNPGFSLLIALAPWLTGGLIGAYFTRDHIAPIRIIAFAGAALIGQELIAALGLLMAYLGVTLFHPIIPLCLALAIVLLLLQTA